MQSGSKGGAQKEAGGGVVGIHCITSILPACVCLLPMTDNNEILVPEQNGDAGGVHPVDGLHARLHLCLPLEHPMDGVRHGWTPRVSSILVVLSGRTFSDVLIIGLTITTMKDVKAFSGNDIDFL